ncbi:hypothetical protein SAMN04488077_12217 [Roseovarius tolerans]|uniref:Uncharacterized protein n=1 Tax=Roseovarius tolerans TaxID=74031 RepID=A0A1H8I1K6_9RHOB|nr:hypothetical protein SAMN04488077_12217 [Roseovarius tolerans]
MDWVFSTLATPNELTTDFTRDWFINQEDRRAIIHENESVKFPARQTPNLHNCSSAGYYGSISRKTENIYPKFTISKLGGDLKPS